MLIFDASERNNKNACISAAYNLISKLNEVDSPKKLFAAHSHQIMWNMNYYDNEQCVTQI